MLVTRPGWLDASHYPISRTDYFGEIRWIGSAAHAVGFAKKADAK
jgi:hypothetical protein